MNLEFKLKLVTTCSEINANLKVEVVVEVGVELYVAVVEAGADLQHTFPDGLQTMTGYRL